MNSNDKITVELLTMVVGLLTDIKNILLEEKQQKESRLPRSI